MKIRKAIPRGIRLCPGEFPQHTATRQGDGSATELITSPLHESSTASCLGRGWLRLINEATEWLGWGWNDHLFV